MSLERCLPPVPHAVLRSRADVDALWAANPDREWYANELAGAVAGHDVFTLPGFCAACEKPSTFEGRAPQGSTLEAPLMPNLREMLWCPTCLLVNRQRLAASTIHTVLARQPGRQVIYLHERITAMYDWITARYGDQHEIIGSEYLGPDRKGGEIVDGVRHEDVLDLSFDDTSVDVILSTDVLEHVAEIEPTLAEAARILRPGGALVFSIPFHYTEDETHRRAELLPDGSVNHLREPEYHGNPTLPDEGSLVFYDYGWDLLDTIKAAGFSDAGVIAAWSIPHVIIGERFQPLFIAVKD